MWDSGPDETTTVPNPSPDDIESLVEAEFLIRGYHWNVLCQSLSDDLPVEGVGVVKRQPEELTGVSSSVRQNAQFQILDSNKHTLMLQIQFSPSLFDRNFRQRDGADLNYHPRGF